MTVDVEGFDSMMVKILVEKVVKNERSANRMARIFLVNAHLGREELPVEVRCTEKVMMGKQNGSNRQ